LYAAYVLDSVLFALRAARTTYLGKIAEDPTDITPTIATGITIDHAVAMSLPVLSGYIWEAYGFQWVFILAAGIAIVGFFVCLQIRVPDRPPEDYGSCGSDSLASPEAEVPYPEPSIGGGGPVEPR
jgi:hypothetical protein